MVIQARLKLFLLIMDCSYYFFYSLYLFVNNIDTAFDKRQEKHDIYS